MRLNQLGESKVIEIIKKITGRRQPEVLVSIGDDASVLKDGTVITTDSYLENVHFNLSYMSFKDVGKRSACATLSDIAAMAAKPIGLFISLFVPSKMQDKDLIGLYQGMDEICRIFSVEIAGGDIVAGEKLGLSLTALGKTKRPILRSTAQPDDYLYITGNLALAETGRLILQSKATSDKSQVNPFQQEGSRRLQPAKHLAAQPKGCGYPTLKISPFGQIKESKVQPAIQRHIAPIPRIFEAQKLAKYATSMIDTSDGLSTDAFHLATESEVKIKIFAEALPVANITKEITKVTNQPMPEFIYNSGEDYELLFTTRKELPFNRILKTPITKIGIVEKGRGVWIVEAGKERRLLPKGYDHLKK
jgi:thiamine-monophosphate kinase